MEKLIFLLSMQFFHWNAKNWYCTILKNIVMHYKIWYFLISFSFWLPKNSLKPEKKLAFSYKPTGKDSTKFQDILLFHCLLYLETYHQTLNSILALTLKFGVGLFQFSNKFFRLCLIFSEFSAFKTQTCICVES